jgi:tRNA (cytosine38-C5)-methyltransferase
MNFNQYQEVNTIMMSPPCQPFSRLGLFKDEDDTRCEAFISICNVIKEEKLQSLSYILMENVKGFEKSRMREQFLITLKLAGFHFQEFILSPTQIGIPNTRHRYYCIARKNLPFSFKSDEIVRMHLNLINKFK